MPRRRSRGKLACGREGTVLSRRSFGRSLAGSLAALPALSEAVLAQRQLIGPPPPGDTVWLNANENPQGPGEAALEAMRQVLPDSGRYHFEEFRPLHAAVAASVGLDAEQVLVGAGSSEILHAAIDAFTSPERPLITLHPSYELPFMVAGALGRRVIRVPLADHHGASVKSMVEEAARAGGGLLYVCNPNNPTGALTPSLEIDWMIENLPANTFALIDEAYIHFADDPGQNALEHVKKSRNVIVTRTFSKIYGMAGLRIGFGCARGEFIRRMEPFRDTVVSIVGARAALAALLQGPRFLEQRRAVFTKIRADLCAWLKAKNVAHIESQANFVMIDIGRDPREFGLAMLKKGVVVGRPFPPLNRMLRVSLGTEQDMARFREAFWEVYKA